MISLKDSLFFGVVLAISGVLIFLAPDRASAAVCDQFLTQGDYFTVGRVSGEFEWAQGFTVAEECTVASVEVNVSKVGTPTDDLFVKIYDDNSMEPDTVLETGTGIDGSTLSASYAMHESVFAGTLVLSPATQYWLALERETAADSSNYYRWGMDTDAGSVLYQADVGGDWSIQTGWHFSYIINGVEDEEPPPEEGENDLYATSTVVSYRDWMFVEMVKIFLLSFVPLGLFMSFFRSK